MKWLLFVSSLAFLSAATSVVSSHPTIGASGTRSQSRSPKSYAGECHFALSHLAPHLISLVLFARSICSLALFLFSRFALQGGCNNEATGIDHVDLLGAFKLSNAAARGFSDYPTAGSLFYLHHQRCVFTLLL
jgi:hypothetical protein